MNGWQKGALAEPVPPAGGEPEVFAWARDVPKPGHLGGIITTEFKNRCVRADGSPGGFEHTVPLIRLEDHRAHVTRLQANSVTQLQDLKRERQKAWDQRDALRAELTKARELFQESRHIIASEVQRLKTMEANFPKGFCATGAVAILDRYDAFLSNQSAPADKGQL